MPSLRHAGLRPLTCATPDCPRLVHFARRCSGLSARQGRWVCRQQRQPNHLSETVAGRPITQKEQQQEPNHPVRRPCGNCNRNIASNCGCCFRDGRLGLYKVALASASTFSGSVVRTPSGGERLRKVCCRGTSRFGHLCSQFSSVCGSSLHSGHVGSAAGSSRWAYALWSRVCPPRRWLGGRRLPCWG